MSPARTIKALELAPGVVLRHPRRDDMAEYTDARLASRDFLERWEPIPPQGTRPFSPAQFRRFLETSNSDLSQRFLVCLLGTGAIVGQVSLNSICRGAFQNCTIGYWIAQPWAQRGYMTQALRLGLEFGFRKLKLHRIEANIMPRNAPSKALAKRVGLRYEGTSPRYLQIAGAWEDHEHWAMTAEEWPAARDAAVREAALRVSTLRASSSTPARSPAST
jgi:ribosomal-protein-alanine N-acetyltransferase